MKYILLFTFLYSNISFGFDVNNLAGTYYFGKDVEIEDVGEIYVSPNSEHTVLLYIHTNNRAPSYSSLFLFTEIEIKNNIGYYVNEEGKCKIGFEFFDDKIKILECDSYCSPTNLNNKVFNNLNKITPTSFIMGDGTAVEMNKTVDNFSMNYYKNQNYSIYDFTGIWHYKQGAESMNISVNEMTNEIVIQYHSFTDGFEDRIFQNCELKGGKIIGDFWGSQKNVKIELSHGNILLTVDPLHEFAPIIKQVFLKSPHNNDIIKKQHPLYVINPLISTLTPAELFVSKLYSVEKLEKNILTVKVAEQNKAGQSKLFVDEELYKKMGLHLTIKPFPKKDNPKSSDIELTHYITGTVNLSQEYYTIVIDFQYDNFYETYLVNFDLKGKYIDNLLIGSGDYVESFNYKASEFTKYEIFVNSYTTSDTNSVKLSYDLYESERYILSDTGEFNNQNYDKNTGN
jgi:hypothetical protein